MKKPQFHDHIKPSLMDGYQETRERLKGRADFAPSVGRPPIRTEGRPGDAKGKTLRESYLEKMDRYREQILSLIKDMVPPDLFSLFDLRSMDKILSEEENSAIAAYSDLLSYLTTCTQYQVACFPVDDAAIEFYLNYLNSLSVLPQKGEPRRPKISTIERRMASLAKWHKWLELDDFRKTYRVADRLKRTRKDHRGPQKQAEGLSWDHLMKAQEVFDPRILRDCVDMALLFTGFYTMCRRSELIGFEWSDLKINPVDHSGTLFLNYSKTDKSSDGKYLFLSPVTVGILMHWQAKSGIRTGPIFRSVYSTGELGEFLAPKGIDRAMKRIARRIGLDYLSFSGHSTRVGATKEMVGKGISIVKIMLAGRWKSERMVVRYAQELEATLGAAADLAKIVESPAFNAKNKIIHEDKQNDFTKINSVKE